MFSVCSILKNWENFNLTGFFFLKSFFVEFSWFSLNTQSQIETRNFERKYLTIVPSTFNNSKQNVLNVIFIPWKSESLTNFSREKVPINFGLKQKFWNKFSKIVKKFPQICLFGFSFKKFSTFFHFDFFLKGKHFFETSRVLTIYSLSYKIKILHYKNVV